MAGNKKEENTFGKCTVCEDPLVKIVDRKTMQATGEAFCNRCRTVESMRTIADALELKALNPMQSFNKPAMIPGRGKNPPVLLDGVYELFLRYNDPLIVKKAEKEIVRLAK